MIHLDGGRVAHDGEEIAWESAGDPDNPDVVVLCHGAGGNRAAWYQQVPALAERYRVVTWDHRGFGDSTDRAGRSAPDVAVGDLAAVLDVLGVGRAHIVGQSMGGWTALGFTLAQPERVVSLVLADTLGGCPVEPWFARASGPPRTDPAGGPVLGRHVALGPYVHANEPTKIYLYQQLGGLGRPFGSGIPATVLRGLFSVRHAPDALAAVRQPVLCLVGTDDAIFPPAWIREVAAFFAHGQYVEIADAGHSPYFEQPDAWNRAVLAFLGSA